MRTISCLEDIQRSQHSIQTRCKTVKQKNNLRPPHKLVYLFSLDLPHLLADIFYMFQSYHLRVCELTEKDASGLYCPCGIVSLSLDTA